jgi:hypothetical protein
VSKTFKALQRAAEEQARRLRREGEETRPAPAGSPPPSAAMARLFAMSHPHTPPPAPPTAAPPRAQALRSEVDLQLRELLENSFRPSAPELAIGDDGWVQGRLDREALLTLRRRHALLHCLHKSETESFWFWGSALDAAALAAATGFPLDAEVEAAEP